MKRLMVLLCAALLCFPSLALAEVTITRQPETQTVPAGGSVTFTVKAKGAGGLAVTWYFTDPATGETTTGKKLSSAVSGVKVRNPNTLSITLNNVPESMHGWTLHCHIGRKGEGTDTDEVMILIEGKGEQQASGEAAGGPEGGEEDAAGADAADAGESEPGGDAGEADGDASGENVADAGADESAAASAEQTAGEPGTDNPSGATANREGSAAADTRIRGFDENAKEQYQYMVLGTYYYGKNGEKAPLVWRVLYRKENIAQLITENVIDAMQMIRIEDYDTAVKNKKKFKSRYNTPYEEMDIYQWLNGEMAEVIFGEQDFSAAVVPHKIVESVKNETDVALEPGYQTDAAEEMTPEEKEKFPYGKDLFYIMTYADMKNEQFGFPKTTHGNTIENEGEIAVPESGRRKAYPTPYAEAKVQYPDWKKDTPHYSLDVVVNYKGMNYGGASPYWAVKRRPGYYMSGIVGANGHLSWSNMASVRIGVRPAAIVDLSRLTVTGGSGTPDDPWQMAPIQ